MTRYQDARMSRCQTSPRHCQTSPRADLAGVTPQSAESVPGQRSSCSSVSPPRSLLDLLGLLLRLLLLLLAGRLLALLLVGPPAMEADGSAVGTAFTCPPVEAANVLRHGRRRNSTPSPGEFFFLSLKNAQKKKKKKRYFISLQTKLHFTSISEASHPAAGSFSSCCRT